MITNETIKTQLNHRTIREFKDEAVPKEVFNTLMEVVKRTATSNGMQTYSRIRKRKKPLLRLGDRSILLGLLSCLFSL